MKHNSKLLIFILLTFLYLSNFTGKSQNKKSFTEVDATTYTLYMKGDWKALIQEGNAALKAGTDYFYLRMRIAYAHYQLSHYRLAIPHYEQALRFNQKDVNAMAYLLHCYDYSGWFYDATKLSRLINSDQLPQLHKKYKSTILSAGMFYTYNKGQTNPLKAPFSTSTNLVDGVQKTTNQYHGATAIVSHRIGRSIILNHSFGYLNKNENIYSITNGETYETLNQSLNQWSYNLQMQMTPFQGFNVLPGFHYANTQIPLDQSTTQSSINTDFNESSILYSLQLRQDFMRIKLGVSYSTGEVNNITQKQTGIHLTLYPLANLNLYYSFDGYLQQQTHETQSISDFTHKHVIGFKITDHLWLEASGLFPMATNFYDVNTGILYNSLEGIQNQLNLKAIIALKNSKLSIITNIGSYSGVSEFVPTNTPLNRSNTQTYNNLNITGGIIWKL